MLGGPNIEEATVIKVLLALWLIGMAHGQLEVISSPPEMVSGGEARLRLTAPPEAEVVLLVNGQPAALTPQDGVWEGVVRGLPLGESRLVARVDGAEYALTLINHPASGPIFSGPQQQPFLCAIAEHRARAGLGEPLDAQCTLARVVSFVYLDRESGRFEPFNPAQPPEPARVATTTTTEGRELPFIVRWERGTLNRFIYSLALLDPELNEAEPGLGAWNRRLIYHFGGGVGIGRYQGNPSPGAMLPAELLGLGYAVAYSTGTVTGLHYNLELGAETAIMVKSRFIVGYGLPDYTVGLGGSGGAIQQYIYAQNFPGLIIDAAIPQYSYPDMITQTIHVGDCELLERWMDAEVLADPDSPWARWSNRQALQGLNAVDDMPNPRAELTPWMPSVGSSECINGWMGLSALVMNPHFGTVPGITPELQREVEWTHWADLINIYGQDADGFGRRTWDNVGVQYGLAALREGILSPEAFLRLNAQIGSWKPAREMVQEGCPYVRERCDDPEEIDIWSARNMYFSRDETIAPRHAADPEAVAAAYARGLVFRGEIAIPVIDWRHYLERELDMHNAHQSFAARARIERAMGDSAHQLIWFTDAAPGVRSDRQVFEALALLDVWLANMAARPELSVADNRPPEARDACFDAAGELIYRGEDAWAGVLDERPAGPCTQRFPLYSSSRIIAGGPISGDVFKCVLQPVAAAIAQGLYGEWVPDARERERLEAIFPEGVCDYRLGDALKP